MGVGVDGWEMRCRQKKRKRGETSADLSHARHALSPHLHSCLSPCHHPAPGSPGPQPRPRPAGPGPRARPWRTGQRAAGLRRTAGPWTGGRWRRRPRRRKMRRRSHPRPLCGAWCGVWAVCCVGGEKRGERVRESKGQVRARSRGLLTPLYSSSLALRPVGWWVVFASGGQSPQPAIKSGESVQARRLPAPSGRPRVGGSARRRR